MSRLDWENEEGYEESPIIFPDDDVSTAASGQNDGAQEVPFAPDGEIDYDMRGTKQEDWSIRDMTSRMRRSTDDSPVRYPEGSLGAFSTPEDYEAHMNNVVEPRDQEPQEIEYDDPILLFPPDEMDDDYYRTTYSNNERPRLANATEDGDLDDSIGISFSRYTAENKEGEFFFMPFLDIPDESDAEDADHPRDEEEEEEEVSFSFRKVDAEQVKKEKEFIFMPFLNASEETPSDRQEEEEELHNRRSSKGTIFDEGLYLIPLESEEEEEEHAQETKSDDEDDDEGGISFVSTVGGVVPKAPRIEGTGEKKTSLKKEEPARAPQKKKKKRPPAASKAGAPQKKQPAQGGKNTKPASGKNNAAEEQFRAAMRNVSPEIRAAVKNDPVQRAALEQAVRIALVQQAAQEAVEKATGRPVFGGFSGGVKKKRPPRAPQQRSGPTGGGLLGGSSRARNVNFSPFSLRTSYEDGGVSEFGASSDSGSAASEFGAAASTQPAAAATQPAAPATQQTTPAPELGVPDNNQDPVLALLNGNLQDNKDGSAPGATQTTRRGAAYQSPAAVRAAMRTGLDVDTPAPTAAAATATGPKTVVSAADRELQVKRSGCLIWIIVAFVVFFVGLVGVLVMPNISKQTNFDKALNLMENGQYLQAIQMFEGFTEGDTKYYEDSRTNISQCAYLQANRYFSEGKYYEAYNLLVDKAEYNEETKELALRANYNYAEQRYAEGDWQNASNAYINLLGEQYEDSQEKYNICQYQLALKNAEEGSYMQAYQLFTSLGEYSDSRFQAARMIYESWNADALSITNVQLIDTIDVMEDLGSAEAMEVVEKIYAKAGQFAGSGDHKVAYETYIALGDYSDSQYRSAQALYNVWYKDYSFGSLAQRRDAMEILRRRADEDEQAATMLMSAGFNPIRLLGRWSDGDSTMTLSIAEGTTDKFVLNMDLASVNDARISVQSSDVIFDGNVVFRLTDPDDPDSRRSVFQVTSFDSLTETEPGTFTFYCFLNNRDYSFERQ